MESCRFELPQAESQVKNTCGLNLVDLTKSVADSVVKTVSPEGGLGSGFMVSNGRENLIVTDEHNLDENSASLTILHRGDTYEGTVIARDTNSDLAILKTDRTLSNPPARALDPYLDIPKAGDGVVAFGFPEGVDEIQVSAGKMRGRDSFYNDQIVLNATQACTFGSSGSIQVTGDGRWWGIQQSIGPHYECTSLSAINVVELIHKIPGWENYAVKH